MIDNHEFPIGFTMELAQHTKVLNHFSGMSEQQQKQIVDGARNIHSRQEMRTYVTNMLDKEDSGHETNGFS